MWVTGGRGCFLGERESFPGAERGSENGGKSSKINSVHSITTRSRVSVVVSIQNYKVFDQIPNAICLVFKSLICKTIFF